MMDIDLSALNDSDTCPVCRNAYLIDCPAHMVDTDEDGWCRTCDSLDLGKVSCPCQTP